eukprot:m.267818 g.267818  ORF g.267818 m.267818 type:complete len:306 (+) comp26790_c0_seq1:229-1146(+)
MPPAKHGKNATANPVYSQHERRKDNDSEGYGTQKRRAATLSMQPFDCCHLSSQPAKMPVITPGGYLYDKANILENLLHQKQEISRKLKAYEKQRERYEALQSEEAAAAHQKELDDFRRGQRSAAANPSRHFEGAPAPEKSVAGKMLELKKETIQTEQGKIVPKMPSFWIPSYTPGAKASEVKPPDTKTKCPMSGQNLKLKDLVAVNFTLADKHSTEAIEARKERYVCGVTHKPLRNAVPCCVLRKTGLVITLEAYERLVKPDMVDPVTSEKLTPKDIIMMQSSGTGFSEKGGEVKKLRTAAAQVA